MTATIAPLASPARPSAPRVLGALGILGSPVFLAQWLAAPSSLKVPDTTTAALLGLLYLAGWACSAVALRHLRATGHGRGGAAILAVQIVGLSLAAGQQIQDALHAHPLGDVVYGVCDAAWPLSHVFMLVVGVAVLRARAWTGWRRWTPLACGLALPAAFVAMAVGGPRAMLPAFAILTAAAFCSLGAAVVTHATS